MPTCRDMATVIASANPDNNTALGGHVTRHIYGMRPPAGDTQLGRTLFADKQKFIAVWRYYAYAALPCNCGGGGQAQQVVTLRTLRSPLGGRGLEYIDAYSCTAVNGHGECTAYTAYMADQVFFGFLLVAGTWVLNTAFPQPMV